MGSTSYLFYEHETDNSVTPAVNVVRQEVHKLLFENPHMSYTVVPSSQIPLYEFDDMDRLNNSQLVQHEQGMSIQTDAGIIIVAELRSVSDTMILNSALATGKIVFSTMYSPTLTQTTETIRSWNDAYRGLFLEVSERMKYWRSHNTWEMDNEFADGFLPHRITKGRAKVFDSTNLLSSLEVIAVDSMEIDPVPLRKMMYHGIHVLYSPTPETLTRELVQTSQNFRGQVRKSLEPSEMEDNEILVVNNAHLNLCGSLTLRELMDDAKKGKTIVIGIPVGNKARLDSILDVLAII